MGAGRENDYYVGLKIAKRLALGLAPLCARHKIGPFMFYWCDNTVVKVWSGLGTKTTWLGLGKDHGWG